MSLQTGYKDGKCFIRWVTKTRIFLSSAITAKAGSVLYWQQL